MIRLVPLLALLVAAGCITPDDAVCGDGTVLVRSECVPETRIECGNGTVEQNGECVAELETCGPGLQLDATGRCVLQDGTCVPPLEFDPDTRVCFAPVSCGVGTERQGAVCVPSCEAPFNVPAPNRDGCLEAARVQFVHGYPSATRPAVDVWAASNVGEFPSGIRFAQNIAFGEATPVFKVPLDSQLFITDAGESGIERAFLNSALVPLTQDGTTFVVLRSGGAGDALDAPALGYASTQEAPDSPEGFGLSAYHAAIGVGTFDMGRLVEFDTVSSDRANTLFEDLEYGGESEYRESTNTILTAGAAIVLDAYERIRSSSADVFASFQTSAGELVPAPVGPAAGTAGVWVAMGFRDPPQASDPGFQIVWVKPDGRTATVDRAAQVQFVHAAGPPNSIDLDVRLVADADSEFIEGPPLADRSEFQSGTPFDRFPSAVPLRVLAFEDDGKSTPDPRQASEAQLAFPTGLTAGRQRVVAYTDAESVLRLVSLPAGPARVSQGFGADVFHAAPGLATVVDLHISDRFERDLDDAELSGLQFGTMAAVPDDDDALEDFDNKLFTFTFPDRLEVLAERDVRLRSVFSPEGEGEGYLFVLLPHNGDEAVLIVAENGDYYLD